MLSAGSDTSCAKRDPEVHTQINVTERIAGNLHDDLTMLRDRLGFVMRPAEPREDERCGKGIDQSTAPLAEHLKSLNRNLAGIQEIVRDIMERLEV